MIGGQKSDRLRERERSEWMEDGGVDELWVDLDGGQEREREQWH